MPEKTRRPNIVLILIDDMGWRDLGCTGSDFYETPNIDRLAASGTVFTQAYATCPVCSPSRASILTGKYPASVGITEWIGGNNHGRLTGAPYRRKLSTEEVTVAKALHAGGYRTWHVGKWHLGGPGSYPEDHGFEVNIGGYEAGWPEGGYFAPYENPRLPDGPTGEYLTDRLTDEAIRLVRGNRDRPFFLNLWHYTVHTPIEGKPDLVAKYEAKAEKLGLDRMEALKQGEPFSFVEKRDKYIVRRLIQSDPGYAAMVENLDENVGRLVRALEESGQADDTVIVFTSDNGGLATAEGSPTTNLPLREGKGWMEEGGTRVPLSVTWPGRAKAGARCAAPVTGADLFPTFLEAAGLPLLPVQHRDGMSILPLIRGAERLGREAVFWHYPHYSNQGGTPGSSIRAGDLKLIEFFETGKLELYDLAADPEEKRDLAPADPGTSRRLHGMLKEWRKSAGARLPEPNPDYHMRQA
jgi:arylsulfatase A-like enzyme